MTNVPPPLRGNLPVIFEKNPITKKVKKIRNENE